MTIWLHLIQKTEKSGFGGKSIRFFSVQNQTEKPSQIMYQTSKIC